MNSVIDLSQHLQRSNRFCYPDWFKIGDVIESTLSDSEKDDEWHALSRVWVERNRDALGASYEVYETDNFLILSDAKKRLIRDACSSFESSLKSILKRLSGAAIDEGYGKHVVMMFSDLDDYYQYISHFYPDGEFPMSGGVCLSSDGYIHFAFTTVDFSSYQTVLVHELTHGCLAHLPLPLWLNEAVAMRMEQAICRTETFYIDQEIYEKHCTHWNSETIQKFWTGESWAISGDSSELSYNLAQILFRKIEVDLETPKESIIGFIADASDLDAGNSACETHLDIRIEDLVADFLGEGEWKFNNKPPDGGNG